MSLSASVQSTVSGVPVEIIEWNGGQGTPVSALPLGVFVRFSGGGPWILVLNVPRIRGIASTGGPLPFIDETTQTAVIDNFAGLYSQRLVSQSIEDRAGRTGPGAGLDGSQAGEFVERLGPYINPAGMTLTNFTWWHPGEPLSSLVMPQLRPAFGDLPVVPADQDLVAAAPQGLEVTEVSDDVDQRVGVAFTAPSASSELVVGYARPIAATTGRLPPAAVPAFFAALPDSIARFPAAVVNNARRMLAVGGRISRAPALSTNLLVGAGLALLGAIPAAFNWFGNSINAESDGATAVIGYKTPTVPVPIAMRLDACQKAESMEPGPARDALLEVCRSPFSHAEEVELAHEAGKEFVALMGNAKNVGNLYKSLTTAHAESVGVVGFALIGLAAFAGYKLFGVAGGLIGAGAGAVVGYGIGMKH